MRGGRWRIGFALIVRALIVGTLIVGTPVAGIVSLAAGQAWAAEPLRVAVAPAVGFGAVDRDGQLTGFNVDIARALCEEMAARCDIVMQPFNELMDRLAARRDLDFVVASVLRTPERERAFLFTDRYWRSSSTFVARIGEIQRPFIEAGAGKRIATLAGSRQQTFLLDRMGGRPGVTGYATDDDVLDAVRRGEADMALIATVSALLLLSSDERHGLEFVGDPITENGLGGDVAIALPFGREALRDRVNQALRTILLNGRYDAISSRYFPFRVY